MEKSRNILGLIATLVVGLVLLSIGPLIFVWLYNGLLPSDWSFIPKVSTSIAGGYLGAHLGMWIFFNYFVAKGGSTKDS